MNSRSYRSNPRRWVLVALLALCSAGAMAAPVACGDKPIRLALYEFGAFYFQGKQGVQGIDKDIVDELVKRSGCKFDIQVLARARIWAELATGALDMSVSGIQTPERDRFAWFAPYLSMKNYVVVGAGIAGNSHNAENFLRQPELLFGAVRAFRHGTDQDKWLDILRSQNRVQDSANVETLFKKLKEGRIHALFSQPAVYGKSLADLGMQKDVVIQDWTPGEKGIAHGLILAKARFSEADAKAWQALVSGLREDGSLKRIFSRYLSGTDAAALLNF